MNSTGRHPSVAQGESSGSEITRGEGNLLKDEEGGALKKPKRGGG